MHGIISADSMIGGLLIKMYMKKRVLYNSRGSEIAIEVDGIKERLVFTANNGTGFSGDNLKQLEDNANATTSAAREMLTILEDLKDAVNDKAPAMLGYQGYVSVKETKKREFEDKMDTVLKNLKAYPKPEEEDAI